MGDILENFLLEVTLKTRAIRKTLPELKHFDGVFPPLGALSPTHRLIQFTRIELMEKNIFITEVGKKFGSFG